MSQSLHLPSRISPKGTAQLHSALERFKRALDDDERRDFEYLNNQPDPATVLKFTAHLDEISAERQSRCIATRLQTVLQSVQQFSAVVETFVASNPKVAALVWGSVKFALLLASNFGSYFEKLSALFMKFGRHCPRYTEYQNLYLDSPRLQSGLCSFYAALVDCCTRAVEVMKKPGWVQAARIIALSSFESDFISYEQQLQHWSKEIKDEISAAAQRAEDRERRAQSEERGRAQAHRLWHRRKAKEQDLEMERVRSMHQKQSLLEKLSNFNHIRPWTRARRQCVGSTGEWLTKTNQFHDWMADGASSMLYLHGKLGSGKTIITASTIATLSRHSANGENIGYFFCRFDEEASLSATTILSSLLRQILRAETLSPVEQSSLEKILDPGPPEIEDLEYLLKGAVLNSGTLFIVVDALDECTESERYILFKAFKSIVELPDRTVKLFLSGRDCNNRHMRRMFHNIHFVSTSSPESKSDLREVVRKRLDELVAEEHLVLGHPSIFQEIEDHLLTKADGMFLWVDFALQDLCSQRRDCDIRAALQRLPVGLPETYDRLLGQIRKSGERCLVAKIFRWIACAKRPLSLEELGEAIAIEPGQKSSEPDRQINDLTTIPSWCRGLVICDEEDGAMQFAHSTIKTFLLKKFLSEKNLEFHVDAETADHELGEICVTYLTFSDFQTQLVRKPKPQARVRGDRMLAATIRAVSGQTDILRTVSTASQLASKLLRRTERPEAHFTWPQQQSNTNTLQTILGSHPFLQYASSYWLDHCNSLSSEVLRDNHMELKESPFTGLKETSFKFERPLKKLWARGILTQDFIKEQQHCGLPEWIQASEHPLTSEQLESIVEHERSRAICAMISECELLRQVRRCASWAAPDLEAPLFEERGKEGRVGASSRSRLSV